MNKKLYTLSALALALMMAFTLTTTAIASPASPPMPGPGDVVIHLPFDTGTISATTSQHVWLMVGWAASTPAKVRLFEGAFQINTDLDGTSIMIPFARRLWGPIETWTPGPGITCPTNTAYRSYWYYDLGTLPAGDHPLNAVLSVFHPLDDGCSTNGVPDTYSGVFATDSLTISVSP